VTLGQRAFEHLYALLGPDSAGQGRLTLSRPHLVQRASTAAPPSGPDPVREALQTLQDALLRP